VPLPVSVPTSLRLNRLGESAGATYYMMRVAVVAPVIAAVVRSDTAVIHSAITGRTHVLTQRMFGPFANVAVVPVHCDWELTFRDFVGRVARTIIDVQAHAAIPFDQLQAELDAQGVAMPARHLFLHMSTARPPLRFAGLEVKWQSAKMGRPPSIRTLVRFDQYREGTGCYLSFDGRIYDPAGMAEFCGHIGRFMEAAARNPDLSLGKLVEAAGVMPPADPVSKVVAGQPPAGAEVSQAG
jgi:non-ribosomal peptide synthetase component F